MPPVARGLVHYSYGWALAASFAYLLAIAAVLQIVRRHRPAPHISAWPLRTVLFGSFVGSMFSRVLQFVLQTEALVCSTRQPLLRACLRVLALTAQAIGFCGNWVAFTLLVLFFEEVRRLASVGRRRLRTLRAIASAIAVGGSIATVVTALMTTRDTTLLNSNTTRACAFWLYPLDDNSYTTYYAFTTALQLFTSVALLLSGGPLLLATCCPRAAASGFWGCCTRIPALAAGRVRPRLMLRSTLALCSVAFSVLGRSLLNLSSLFDMGSSVQENNDSKCAA